MSDTIAISRLHRQRRLRKNPNRQRNKQNCSDDKTAANALDAVAKHCCLLIAWRDYKRL